MAEGITDYVVLRSGIESMLKGRSFVLTLLQPEGSVAFDVTGKAGTLGGGWKGVYRWCIQAALRGGGFLSGDPLFIGYDLLVLHLDADVADEDPEHESVSPLILGVAFSLPCARPCPPAIATTDALRKVILSWVGERQVPSRTVLCTPSKSTEAWVMAACFPDDSQMAKKGWECHPKPESRLAQLPLPQRFKKSRADYEKRAAELVIAWPTISTKLSEAKRFQAEFCAAVHSIELMPQSKLLVRL